MKRARGVMIYVFAAGDAKFQQSDSHRLTATYSQEHADIHRNTLRLTATYSQEHTETHRNTLRLTGTH